MPCLPGGSETTPENIQLQEWAPNLLSLQAQGGHLHKLQGGVHGESNRYRADAKRDVQLLGEKGGKHVFV